MAALVIISILLTRNLQVEPENISKRQLALETVIGVIQDFFKDILGEKGKMYIPYLMSVAIYIGVANLIGILGFKPPTKDMNVTAALAIMSIVLIEFAGIHATYTGGVADQHPGNLHPTGIPLYAIIR